MAYIQTAYDEDTAWLQESAEGPHAEMPLTPAEIVTLRRCLAMHVLILRWRGEAMAGVQLPQDIRIARPELELLAAYAYYVIAHTHAHTTFVPELLGLWPTLADDILAFMPRSSSAVPVLGAPAVGVMWDRNVVPYPLIESTFRSLTRHITDMYELYARVDHDAARDAVANPAIAYTRPLLFDYDARGHAYSYAGAMLLVQWHNAMVRCTAANLSHHYHRLHAFHPPLWRLLFSLRMQNIHNISASGLYTSFDDLVRQLSEFWRSAEAGRRARHMAFALAMQPRVGENSLANGLDANTVRDILDLTMKR